jgi:hypothetical protein
MYTSGTVSVGGRISPITDRWRGQRGIWIHYLESVTGFPPWLNVGDKPVRVRVNSSTKGDRGFREGEVVTVEGVLTLSETYKGVERGVHIDATGIYRCKEE